jgi:hypothetical protein
MASAMADRSVHATLVRTFLALVMLSACSQEPAEQESAASEPAQEQPAGAQVGCRDEVAAAFKRLRTSGRPYRKEMSSIISDQLTSHETAEFLSPDRMREIWSNGVSGYGSDETIRVGQRAWFNDEGWPWGWREWDPRPADDLLARLQTIPADDVRARMQIFFAAARWDTAALRFLRLQDLPVLPGDVFECLGRVEFEGTVYLGYRLRFDRVEFVMAAPRASSETKQEELSRKPQDKPQEWRTVFVDRESMLPAYDLVSHEYQLNNPRDKVQYTYPDNIKIEPPLWCRIGLCRPVLR